MSIEIYKKSIEELRDVSEKLLINHPEPKKHKEAILLYAIVKTDKTINAIELLCNNGMGEDATILCRSIFELALTTEYILDDKTDYRAKRFLYYDWIQRKKMYNCHAKSKSINIDIPEIKKIITEIEKEAKNAQTMYEYKNNSWSDKNLYEIAKHLKREWLYDTAYRIQCDISHSSPRAMNNYFKEGNKKLIFNSGYSDNLIEETLVTSIMSYHLILNLFNKYFKDKYFSKLQEIENELIKYIQKKDD